MIEIGTKIMDAEGTDSTMMHQAAFAWLHEEASVAEKDHAAWVAEREEIDAEADQLLKDQGGAQAA